MSRTFLRKKWVELNLPRHESKTLLWAIQTAKDLLTESVSPIVCINNLKNATATVYYYIVIFYLNQAYTIAKKSPFVKPKILLFFWIILLRPKVLINKGLPGGAWYPLPLTTLPLLWNHFDAVRLDFRGGYYFSISNSKTMHNIQSSNRRHSKKISAYKYT